MVAVVTTFILFFGVLQGPAAAEKPKIVNGFPLKISEAPYQVAILWKGLQFCGGSIISAQHVLSAAHCFEDYTAEDYTVRSGSNHEYKGGCISRVSHIITHPKYGKPTDWHNDLTVLILAEKLEWNSFTRAIALRRSEVLPEDRVLVSGWGSLDAEGSNPETLQGAFMRIFDRKSCQNYYDIEITPSMICTTDERTSACTGDSGGPLVTSLGQIGTVTGGKKGCKIPGVFMNVPAFRSFINVATNYSVTWS